MAATVGARAWAAWALKLARLAWRQADPKGVLHQCADPRQGHQVLLAQVHRQGFDASAVLHCAGDALGPGPNVYRPTGAVCTHQVVFNDLKAHWRQIKHLALLDHFVVHQGALAGGTDFGTFVLDHSIDVFAGAQGSARVTLLAAAWALARNAQRLGVRFAQAVAAGGFA